MLGFDNHLFRVSSFDYVNWGSSRNVNRRILLSPLIRFKLERKTQAASDHGGPSTGWCFALRPLPSEAEWLCCMLVVAVLFQTQTSEIMSAC